MTEITDEVIAGRLRRLIRDGRIKLTEIADATGIPYRTLQNQLNGQSRMSAVNLLKVLDATNIPSSFLTEESASLNVACLVISLETVLGDHAPRVEVDGSGDYCVTFPPGRTKQQLRADAFNLAAALDREYRIFSVHMADAFARSPSDPEPPSDPVE